MDRLLGFHPAKAAELRSVGVLYFILSSSLPLGEAFELTCRYSTFAKEALRLRRPICDEIGIADSSLGIARNADRHPMEFWATALLRITRHLTGTRVAPAGATLVRSAPRRNWRCSSAARPRSDPNVNNRLSFRDERSYRGRG